MTEDEALAGVIDALNTAGRPYMMVGSVSSNFFGIPRSTKDADVVLESGSSLHNVFAPLSPQLRLDDQLTFETVTGTYRFIARLEKSAFKIEFFLLSDDPHDRERFSRRIQMPLLGRKTFVQTAEDVIVTKLKWSRAKDIDDVRDVISVQGNALDWDYIHRWCDLHGSRARLDDIRRSIPVI